MKKHRALWVIIIVIVVLAASAAGVWFWLQSRLDETPQADGTGFRPKLHGRSRHTALFMHSIRP